MLWGFHSAKQVASHRYWTYITALQKHGDDSDDEGNTFHIYFIIQVYIYIYLFHHDTNNYYAILYSGGGGAKQAWRKELEMNLGSSYNTVHNDRAYFRCEPGLILLQNTWSLMEHTIWGEMFQANLSSKTCISLPLSQRKPQWMIMDAHLDSDISATKPVSARALWVRAGVVWLLHLFPHFLTYIDGLKEASRVWMWMT